MLSLANTVFESSGIILNQDEILNYDAVWLRDFTKYRRLKRVMESQKKHKQDHDEE